MPKEIQTNRNDIRRGNALEQKIAEMGGGLSQSAIPTVEERRLSRLLQKVRDSEGY